MIDLLSLGICMVFSAFFVLGARYIILDGTAKSYCDCGHEFNEHNVVPKGYISREDHMKFSDRSCKICGCKLYKRNDKDKRNTPPPTFFPR